MELINNCKRTVWVIFWWENLMEVYYMLNILSSKYFQFWSVILYSGKYSKSYFDTYMFYFCPSGPNVIFWETLLIGSMQ
jgi:hypothetical protein